MGDRLLADRARSLGDELIETLNTLSSNGVTVCVEIRPVDSRQVDRETLVRKFVLDLKMERRTCTIL